MTVLKDPVLDEPITLPKDFDAEVIRDSLLTTFENHLQEAPVFIVEGEKDIGKTTALAQFYKRHRNNAIGIFLRGSSKWFYDSSNVQEDISRQVWAITGYDGDGDPRSILMQRYQDLARKLRRSGRVLYFILDGLDEIPAYDRSEAAAIMDLLPFGYDQFRFLLSGKTAGELCRQKTGMTSRTSIFPALGLEDAKNLLAGVITDNNLFNVIYKISRGSPGYLNNVRRLFKEGLLLGESNIPKSLSDAFALEWDRVVSSKEAIDIFALMAFDEQQNSVKRIAEILNLDVNLVGSITTGASFINTVEDTPQYISESFREFAADRLKAYKSPTQNAIADWLLANETSIDVGHSLPELLSEIKRYDELVKILDQKFLLHTITKSGSSRRLQNRARLGLEAAIRLDRPEEALRLGLVASNLEEFYCNDDWRLRLEAFLAIKDESGALALARLATTREERLQGLCIVGRFQRTTRGRCDEDLVSEVTSELQKLELKTLGKRAIEIASDLVYVSSELALSILKYKDGSTGANRGEYLDFALAQISLRGNLSNDGRNSDDALGAHEQISNPELRCFTSAMRASVSDLSQDAVLADIEKYKTDQERIYFLRQWLSELKPGKPALSAIEAATKLLIGSESVGSTSAAFLDVLRPLVTGSGCEQVIARIDGQSGLLEQKGPTVDFYKLQIKLAKLQFDFNKEAAIARIEDIYLKISWHGDVSIKLTVLAYILSAVKQWNDEINFTQAEGLLKTLTLEIQQVFKSIKGECATQLRAVRSGLRLLSPANPDLALEIANGLNTQEARDKAHGHIFYKIWLNENVVLDKNSCNKALSGINDPHVRLAVLAAAVREAARKDKTVSKDHINSCLSFINTEIDPLTTAATYVALAVVHGGSDAVKAELISKADTCLGQVKLSAEKVLQYYNLCLIAADKFPQHSQRWLQQAEEGRSTFTLRGSFAQRLMHLNVRLTIRAFAGLLKRRADKDIDLTTLIKVINYSPETIGRTELFTDLAVRLYANGRAAEGAALVRDKILLELNDASTSRALQSYLISIAAPALYELSELECLAWIDKTSDADRAVGVSAIIEYIMTKLPPQEPFKNLERHVDGLTYDSAKNILRLSQKSNSDRITASGIRFLCAFIESDKGARLSRSMISDLEHAVDQVIDSAFPFPKGIAHLGYQILSKIYRLKLEKPTLKNWESLVMEAKAIPNTADIVLLLTTIAENAPPKFSDFKRAILEDAFQLACKIPYRVDSLGRLEVIAECARKEDYPIFKKCLDVILGATGDRYDDDAVAESRRRAIDLAYEVDPELAEKLSGLHETGNNKPADNNYLKDEIEYLKLRSKSAELQKVDAISGQQNALGRACWSNLGSMNSGSITGASFKRVGNILEAIGQWDVETSFPVLSYVVECAVRNYAHTDQAGTNLRKVFEVCLGSTMFVHEALTTSQGVKHAPAINAVVSAKRQETIIVEPGEREHALNFTEEWLAEFRGETILIIDPFFEPDGLEFVAMIRRRWKDSKIFIICGKKSIYSHNHSDEIESYLRGLWVEKYSCGDLGDVSIVVVTDKQGENIIHDRWWLTETSGLRFGTSWNTLGVGKISDISVFRPNEAAQRYIEMSRFCDFSYLQKEKNKLNFRWITL